MSTLQFLREKAGVLVAGVIGLSLLLFVVSDFFGNGRGQRMKAKKYYEIGEIGGEMILYQDYDLRLQNLLEIYKLSGRSNIDEATTETIREQTWQQIVREKILDTQYKKLGIGVSTEEVDELVLGNNPHQIVQQLFTDQQTGAFNKSFLVNFLKQTEVDETAKKYWLFFENEIVNDRMNTKYNNLVSKGLYVTSKQAEFDKNLAGTTVDFSYILKNYASLSDSSVTISENDIQSYYSKHKESYKRTAIRDIEYVTFDVVPSEDDIKQTEQWINKTKEEFATATDPVQFINLTADSRHVGFFTPLSVVPENLKDYVKKEDLADIFGPYIEDGSYKVARLLAVADRPDSVHVRHILLTPNQTRSLEVVKRQADSLIKLIKSGTPFEALALANSDDQGSAQIGGDLGWFPEGRMVVPFNNACFSGKKGEIKTAETTFGIHIIEILAQSKDSRKYSIGFIDRKIIPGSVTNQKAYSEASQFAGTNDTYEKFTKSIAEKGLNKRVANDIAPQQKTLPGLDNPRSLIISLFQTEKGKIVLDNSQQAVFEVGDKYVVAYCTKVQEDGIATVKDVENDIRFILIKDKKADIISAEYNKNNGTGKTIDDIARTMGLTVQEATQINFRSYTVQGVGTEPALIAAASVAKQGTVTGPVKGTNGVYMLAANTVTTSQGEDLKLLQDRLKVTFQMRGNYEAYEALRKGANIIDKRYKFY
ncbi:MAG: SurA N-terminal domain-containing protein [Bacteroidales bacterium]|nr:SurA N-terminal domain-containing protein [Bacteroidales bacterium]